MPSEKYRYFEFNETKNQKDYTEHLYQAVSSLKKNELQKVLMHVGECDPFLKFQLVAKLVPMSLDDTITFLKEVITYVKHGRKGFSSELQDEIAKVADRLLERSKEFSRLNALPEAAGITLAIVLAIEPQMQYVTDEGFTFQQVADDAFKMLNSLFAKATDREVLNEFSQTIKIIYNSIPEDHLFFEDKWQLLLDNLINDDK